MKRIVFPLSVMVMGLMSCQSHSSLIQVSDYTVMKQDSTTLFIKDCEFGRTIYESWQSGPFIPTKTKVILVDTMEFKNLCGKAEHHKSYLPQVTTNP
jgi:hypothetical protein